MMELNEREMPYFKDIERLSSMTRQDLADEIDKMTDYVNDGIATSMSFFDTEDWKKYSIIMNWICRSYPGGVLAGE